MSTRFGSRDGRTKLLLKIVFVAVVFLLLSLFVDVRTFARELSKVSTIAVLICIGGELLFYAIESVKILYLGSFNYSFSLILRSRFISAFLANFGPGMVVGDVLRVFILDRFRPGNKVYVASLLVSGRIYGILPLAIFLPICALFHPGTVEKIGKPLILVGVVLGVVIWASPLFIGHPLAKRTIISVYCYFKRPASRKLIRKVYLAFRSFGSARNWAIASVTSLVTTAIVISEFRILSGSMGLGVSFVEWALLVSVISVVTFLPLGFGAIGSQEAALALLAPFFGQSLESFIALSLVIHVIRILGTLPGTLFLDEGFGAVRILRNG